MRYSLREDGQVVGESARLALKKRLRSSSYDMGKIGVTDRLAGGHLQVWFLGRVLNLRAANTVLMHCTCPLNF